jgi:hypothetical protein
MTNRRRPPVGRVRHLGFRVKGLSSLRKRNIHPSSFAAAILSSVDNPLSNAELSGFLLNSQTCSPAGGMLIR